MNQVDIETFLMLVQTRNITKTADNLFVSQPTVSHRLKLLEEELQVPLLERKKGYKKVELTPKGEEFLPIAERWLALIKETQQLQNSSDEMNLAIGCTDTLNSCVFKELYREILNEGTLKLRMNISTQYSQRLYEQLESRLIDVGFVYHHLHYKNIISEPILKEKMYLVQAREGAVKKNRVSLDELDPTKEIGFVWETNYQIWHDQMVSKGRPDGLVVDVYSLLEEFIKDPGRWVIAPVTVANRLKQDRDVYISELSIRKQPPERITYMIRNKDVNEKKLEALKALEARVHQYFSMQGLDNYMERYQQTGI